MYEGTHDSKENLGEKLFHGKTAALAKAWVQEHQEEPAAKPAKQAAKPRPARKPKTTTDTDSTTGEQS